MPISSEVGDIMGFAGDFHPAVAAGQRVIDDVKISFLFGAHFCMLSLRHHFGGALIAATMGT